MENLRFFDDKKIPQVTHNDKDRDNDYDYYNIPNTSKQMKQCLAPQINKQHQRYVKDKN